MIVLRKIRQSTNNIVLAGTLVGDTDGNNKVFTTDYEFNSDNIIVNFNGQKLDSFYDFEVTGSNEITFIYIAPIEQDVLNATYEMV